MKWLNPLRWTRRYRRVVTTLESYRAKLQARQEQAQRILDILQKAEIALNSTFTVDIDKIWRFIHVAQAVDVSQDNLRVPAVALRREADKLTTWRKNAVHDLLGSPEKPKPDNELTARHLCTAASLIYEHYDNQAYKEGLLRSHKWQLCVALGLIIVGLLWWFRAMSVPYWWFGFEQVFWVQSPFNNLKPFEVKFEEAVPSHTLVSVALFGLLGAAVSAIIKFPGSMQSSRIPEVTATLSVTVLRLFMGGASAIIVYVFLGSGLAPQVFTLTDPKNITTKTLFALAIVAGFSERLVARAIEAVAEPKKESTQK
jgi:hypothetical protein